MNDPRPDNHGKPPIIVTGSSGLLGGAVIRDLDEDYQIVGFDRDGEPQPPHRVECICVDITSDESVRLGLKRTAFAYGKKLAAVIHLAAYVDFDEPESPLYQQVTVEGTRRLVNTLEEMEFEVGRFIFSSTMLVHQPTAPGQPITEESPLRGEWAYPQSKIDTENVLRREAAFPIAILRIAGVYTDEGEAPTIVQQIARIHERSPKAHVYPGDLTHGQSFVHLHDALAAIRAAVEKRDELPREATYLIGEPVTYSYDALQKKIAECLHGEPDWKTSEIPGELAKTGAWMQEVAASLPGVEEPFIHPWMVDMADDHYELDIARARRELGWSPRRRLIEAIAKMCHALQDDPAGWYEQHGLTAPG